MASVLDSVLVELECPVCTNYMTPPIRQCSTGHSICDPCRKKLTKCPLCQSLFTNSKNLTLEALAEKMKYPCVNRFAGCTEMLSYRNREKHEKTCVFKGFKCGMEKCPWTGRLEDVLTHWESKKTASKPYHAKNVCHAKLKTDSYYVNILKAYGQIFWFRCKVEKGALHIAVQFIGDARKAEDYYYEIEAFKAGRPQCSVQYSDFCKSADIDSGELFKGYNCIKMQVNNLGKYVGDDQLLIYYVRVFETNKSSGASDGHFKKYKKPRDQSAGPLNRRAP